MADVTDEGGDTVLGLAAANADAGMCEVLLNYGADPTAVLVVASRPSCWRRTLAPSVPGMLFAAARRIYGCAMTSVGARWTLPGRGSTWTRWTS